MDATERALLAEAVAGSLDSLADVGWLDMLAAETDIAIDVVFTAIGRANAAIDVLDDVIVHGLGLTPRNDLAVLLPNGLSTARIARAGEVIVEGRVVPVDNVEIEPVRGIDPSLQLSRVDVACAGEQLTLDRGAWERATALGQRALAHQISGACRAMLDLARTHALEREQFGRPVARFQAVRHRLAEALVAIEALDAALVAAADEQIPQTAALAKAIAGRAARTVGGHAQQVCAGIGFTTEHPLHNYLKRTMVLDQLLGSADELTLEIGRELLAKRAVPALIEL